MKKRTIIVWLVLSLAALIAFCNYPNGGKIAKVNTETVTIQLDTITKSKNSKTFAVNSNYVSEEWLRERLEFHNVNKKDIETFILIAKRESTLNPSVVNRTLNRNKTIDSGLFQINSCHKNLYAKYDLLDPEQNILAALELHKQAGFKPWRASLNKI